MNKFLRVASFWFGSVLTTFATSVGLSDTATLVQGRSGTTWDDATVALGTFDDGFVPTAQNRAQWASHWFTTSTGYYASAGGASEVSAELVLADNVAIPAGQLLYVWITHGSEAGLYSDAAWTAPVASTLGLSHTLHFSAQTVAIFGAFDGAHLVAATASTDLSIVTQPATQSVTAGDSVTFTVVAGGTAPFAYQWHKDGVDLAGATNATLLLASVTNADAGEYQVSVANAAAAITSDAATLTVATAPLIVDDPQSQTVPPGGSLTLTAHAEGVAPFTYQWFKNGVPIPGATDATFAIPAVSSGDAGSYIVRITNSLGTAYSAAALVAVNYGPALSNLSVRGGMTAGQTLITGFVVSGGTKPVLVRAAGPALNAFGLVGVADPRLVLYDGDTVVVTNDDWPASLAPTFASLGAFPFDPDSKDAALMESISGPHTAHTSSTGDGTVLVEAYDAGSSNGVALSNLSARYHVGTGNDILIAGFVLSGSGPQRILIRAVGPTLGSFGVTGVLENPQFSVFLDGQLVASNDDWSAALTSVFQSVGAFNFLADSKDAALLVTLEAGHGYTVQVSGVGGATGEALVEIYTVP
ncbi:immunoglobulin domain-containing protein [Horticoccus luteus]|uniref:Immunoglobulin domain-containing protein n=1 Tax=Horticoccus luteus TaxID=2862869 RepID=A0A8F9XJD8_9BACT|nr:immunoglobulin domain-containing protein [Horticoccus luteus]QYM78563.1 immunoglobulin domain-containing protein [Horticoccus luteus]